MTRNLEAIPTEYNGIQYRSKSEAMFARYLDLSREHRSREQGYAATCEYEPGWAVLDGGWCPDFIQWDIVSLDKQTVPSVFADIIEYKPSIPTRTYINTFWLNSIAIASRIREKHASVLAWPVIYFGSVFVEERGRVIFPSGEIEIHYDDWLAGYEDDVRATRFDLEG